MRGFQASGMMTVSIPIEIISARHGKVVVELDGVRQVVYAGGTLHVSGDVHVTPREPSP